MPNTDVNQRPVWTYRTAITSGTESIVQFKREAKIFIHPSKNEFLFGSCASLAICNAFEIPENAFKLICSLMKIENPCDGITFYSCKKLINALCHVSKKKKAEYISNKGAVSYAQMAILLKKGMYIVMFDEHLSLMIDGEIFDSFLHGKKLEDQYDWLKSSPTGWWKIGI